METYPSGKLYEPSHEPSLYFLMTLFAVSNQKLSTSGINKTGSSLPEKTQTSFPKYISPSSSTKIYPPLIGCDTSGNVMTVPSGL